MSISVLLLQTPVLHAATIHSVREPALLYSSSWRGGGGGNYFFFLCALILKQLLQHLCLHRLYKHSSLSDGFKSKSQKYLSCMACRHFVLDGGLTSSKRRIKHGIEVSPSHHFVSSCYMFHITWGWRTFIQGACRYFLWFRRPITALSELTCVCADAMHTPAAQSSTTGHWTLDDTRRR
jgi:hypothetical protein